MSLRPSVDETFLSNDAQPSVSETVEPWFPHINSDAWPTWPSVSARTAGRPSADEAARIRSIIEGTISDIFGVPKADLSKPSRGKAPVALARQVAMYVAHVTCGLSLTHVGMVFARDRTTVAHACAVVEDKRDDPIFDRALVLMEWIVPAMVGQGSLSAEAAKNADWTAGED